MSKMTSKWNTRYVKICQNSVSEKQIKILKSPMTSNKTWEVQVFKLSNFANYMQNVSDKKTADP
jgi:hypothetical protein